MAGLNGAMPLNHFGGTVSLREEGSGLATWEGEG